MRDLDVLTDIFRDELDNPRLVITEQSTQEDLETWDSLAHVRLIARIEEHYGFEFGLTDIEEATSVERLLRVIEANRAA